MWDAQPQQIAYKEGNKSTVRYILHIAVEKPIATLWILNTY